MGLIKILDESVSNIIAAGEVVESPASMIKELLENSLDAGSSYIRIEIKNGGRDVKILDNGKGMSQEDLLLCIERHATSKISTKEDLFNLFTYGFRGEALSSVAAVSKMSISSKTENDEIGSAINISGGKITNLKEFQRTRGTEIEIRELFFNTPARLKFLRKPSTEYSNIKDIVIKESMANPDVSIILIIEGKESIRTSGRGIENCLLELFGKNIVKNLKSFPLGYLGVPSLNRSSKDSIFTFVNGRAVSSKVLDAAIMEGYHTKLMKGKYPFVILFFEVDPKEVDVNVHPSKKVVKFAQEDEIYSNILEHINESLARDISFTAVELEIEENKSEVNENFNFISMEDFVSFEEKPAPAPPELEQPKILQENKITETVQKNFDDFFENPLTEFKESYKFNIGLKNFKVIGQFLNSFILVERNKELEIYDQHIVHERILYEELKKEYLEKTITSQQLLVPIKMNVLLKEKDLFFDNYELFQNFGFEIDDFGANEILIRAVPVFNFRESIENMMKEILYSLGENSSKLEFVERIINSISCRSAVKINEQLTLEEMEEMISKLHALGEYTCPHGRPIILKLTLDEIEKSFKRK